MNMNVFLRNLALILNMVSNTRRGRPVLVTPGRPLTTGSIYRILSMTRYMLQHRRSSRYHCKQSNFTFILCSHPNKCAPCAVVLHKQYKNMRANLMCSLCCDDGGWWLSEERLILHAVIFCRSSQIYAIISCDPNQILHPMRRR